MIVTINRRTQGPETKQTTCILQKDPKQGAKEIFQKTSPLFRYLLVAVQFQGVSFVLLVGTCPPQSFLWLQ